MLSSQATGMAILCNSKELHRLLNFQAMKEGEVFVSLILLLKIDIHNHYTHQMTSVQSNIAFLCNISWQTSSHRLNIEGDIHHEHTAKIKLLK